MAKTHTTVVLCGGSCTNMIKLVGKVTHSTKGEWQISNILVMWINRHNYVAVRDGSLELLYTTKSVA